LISYTENLQVIFFFYIFAQSNETNVVLNTKHNFL